MRWCFSWYRAVAPGGDSADGVCACSLAVVLVKAKWMARVRVTVIPVAVLLRGDLESSDYDFGEYSNGFRAQ